MKKVFTLILAMTVVFAGFAQVKSVSKNDAKKNAATMQVTRGMESFENVQSEPNMVRWDFGDGELDYTIYDWQSNQGARTWTIVWPDNKVSFAFTCANSTNFNDRGTAIGTYDYNTDTWTPCGGRIENEKTGFGSIARYGQNGIVVAAHTSTNLGVYIIEDKDNIVPNSVPASLYTGNESYTHPAVMTSGANRDIIHLFCGNFDDSSIPAKYWRSSDGGQTWDKSEVILPYIEDSGSDWGTNEYYWMETTEDNCLALVINSAWSDGMVLYSYDDGETWNKKLFYHHPGVNTTIPEDDWALYPRWTSAQWGFGGELCLAYEFNGTRGEPGSGSYFPSLGGVAFWSETMPYHGTTALDADPNNPLPPTPGNPFIMDTAYIMEDVYSSWPLFSDATHDMWPEYMGYLAPLDADGQPEDPYTATEFLIEDCSLHGSYNSGCVAMPVLVKVPGSDFDYVAVWSAMDENNQDEVGNYYYKLFASYTADRGRTWTPQIQLTDDFMLTSSEFVYTQAAVVGNTLVIASQCDAGTGTYVQDNDTDPSDNYYIGLTFDLNELFPEAGVGVSEVSHNTHMSLYPNPAVDQLNITLNQGADVVIYNIMGQAVMNVEGHAGVNTINVSELNAGVYFISAGSDTQKFVVK